MKVNRLLLTNTDVRGVGWGGPAFAEPGVVTGQWSDIVPRIRQGSVAPVVGATFPLDRVAEALAVVDERRALGKVVVQL